eukprot:XP_011663741.1 PREDICTED: wiskott-Aldrich syndrome protein homolog 1-like isoform X1 [Strongylocentrotus purpuratus]
MQQQQIITCYQNNSKLKSKSFLTVQNGSFQKCSTVLELVRFLSFSASLGSLFFLSIVVPHFRQLDQLQHRQCYLPSSPSSVSSTSCDAVSLTARCPQAPSARPAVTRQSHCTSPPSFISSTSCDAVRPTALRRPPAPSALPACDAVRPSARRPPAPSALPACDTVRPTARRPPAQPAVTPSDLLPVVPQLNQL